MRSLKIGNLRLKNRLFLSPMVDVTDLPYRLICKNSGAAMAYTEMLNIGSILYAKNTKTLNILKTNKEDRPVGIQITGKSVEEFRKISKHKELTKFDLVDINCGCPSTRITQNDSGSYLLKTPKKIGEMIKVLKNEGFTVTAKIRLGFKRNNALSVSKEIEKAGADLLTVHARLSNQGKSVPADWEWISKIKKSVGIPVVGNGDVFLGSEASEMLDIADGVMVARGAIGNPGVFKQILHYLRTGKEKEISTKERLSYFEQYLDLAKKYGVVEMPRIKFLGGWFLRGFDGAANAREKFMKLRSFEEIRDFVTTLK